jgi:hypothetical protein
MLTTLEEYVRGTVVRARAAQMAGEFAAALEDEYSLVDTVTYAGVAAVLALKSPLFESPFEKEYFECASDSELDPYGWDAGLAASIAAAGGAVWDNQGSADRRRQFWRRYLAAASRLQEGSVGWVRAAK